MTELRIESVFSKAEIAEMRARFAEEAAARAAQVTTDASRTLLARSRTVIDKDRYVLTVVDGDVLDYIIAIETQASDSGEAMSEPKITLPVSRATILDVLARIMRDRAYPEFVHASPPLWATDAAEQVWAYVEHLTNLALNEASDSPEKTT